MSTLVEWHDTEIFVNQCGYNANETAPNTAEIIYY